MDEKREIVYVTRPYMPPLAEFIPYLEKIWESRWLTNIGQFHQQLEEELAHFLGVKHISLFSNGTLALITALQALRITGEVITTPYSFVASTHSLWWNGIKPVFVDIEPEFMNINAEKIEAAITPQTTAIMPVHVYGNPCDVETIQNIADTYGLKVLYDACHAFGVKIDNNSIFNFGDMSALSFHATKVFTTFEGGALVCNDEKTKKRIDFLKNFGFADEMTVVAPGINAKMNELQAAFGLLQLSHFHEAIDKRRKIAEIYRERFRGATGIRILREAVTIKHNYIYFPIFIDAKVYGKSRDEIYDTLRKNNIYARRYFFPLISQFPAYRSLPSAKAENLPVAEKITSEVLCLPIYPDLETDTVLKICDLVLSRK